MATTKVSTSYKKKDGTLEYDSAKKNLLWVATAGGGPISVPLSSITNLKQTPAASDKVALRVEAGESVFTFAFTSPSGARAEQEAITDVLRKEIQARTGTSSLAASGAGTPAHGATGSNGGGPSAAMAIAHAVRSETNAANNWADDNRLIGNIDLQESLFQKDPELRQRFEQSLRNKPDGISLSQFGTQFWSARIHLLRAHAIEKSQTQGAYNVLAQLKETNRDGTRKLNLTRDHIQVLFTQHPIVKHIYNEVVPVKLSENEFWSRFFVSRLLLKLKGERIRDTHSTDAILDKYLTASEPELRHRQAAQVPHFIDLEGNEQDINQKGNKPHWSMIPEFSGKAPLLGILNSMSERLMANVAPADGPAHAPIGMDEETYNQLRLRDLVPDEPVVNATLAADARLKLFGASGERGSELSAQAQRHATQDRAAVLASMRSDLSTPISLGASAEAAGSGPATDAAVSQLVDLLSQQRERASDAPTAAPDLSPATLQSLNTTHSTTIEFLAFFWHLLLSPSASRQDLAAVHATLGRSVARIEAVADEAERERAARIAELHRAAKEYTARTGRRRKADEGSVTLGGAGVIRDIMAPTVEAIEFARRQFELVVKE